LHRYKKLFTFVFTAFCFTHLKATDENTSIPQNCATKTKVNEKKMQLGDQPHLGVKFLLEERFPCMTFLWLDYAIAFQDIPQKHAQ
jgi:hypothetical protein